jgi:flagellar basal body-associated protein FliL
MAVEQESFEKKQVQPVVIVILAVVGLCALLVVLFRMNFGGKGNADASGKPEIATMMGQKAGQGPPDWSKLSAEDRERLGQLAREHGKAGFGQ